MGLNSSFHCCFVSSLLPPLQLRSLLTTGNDRKHWPARITHTFCSLSNSLSLLCTTANSSGSVVGAALAVSAVTNVFLMASLFLPFLLHFDVVFPFSFILKLFTFLTARFFSSFSSSLRCCVSFFFHFKIIYFFNSSLFLPFLLHFDVLAFSSFSSSLRCCVSFFFHFKIIYFLTARFFFLFFFTSMLCLLFLSLFQFSFIFLISEAT
ncbi:unnamed protein product [Acanthosepion pharaonis]|uniref:Transmembrane protein n=1 Tax=Acanthosepion pharaonis TaxID=158019 RepID=A0A812D585_ACAPH|nr:unnamed protein product [Sepia pharaonis]